VRTGIASTSSDAIVIRGRDLAGELMGHIGYTDMMILTALGRLPSPQERVVVDAIAVSLMDHGITPSSLAARLTLLGAPESFQGAVAAGLSGAGSTFLGGMSDVTEMLRAALGDLDADAPDALLAEVAESLVSSRRDAGRKLPGIGHNVHTKIDPRVARMRQIVTDQGFYDRHWRLMDHIPDAFLRVTGRSLPMNNVGAVGASIAALGYPAQLGRGIALAARAAGLVAHLLEEMHTPLAQQAWEHILAEAEQTGPA
jgi:citrate synthase